MQTFTQNKTTETANYKMASAEHDKYMVAYRESQARERESQARETASRKGNVSDVRIERVEQPNL